MTQVSNLYVTLSILSHTVLSRLLVNALLGLACLCRDLVYASAGCPGVQAALRCLFPVSRAVPTAPFRVAPSLPSDCVAASAAHEHMLMDGMHVLMCSPSMPLFPCSGLCDCVGLQAPPCGPLLGKALMASRTVSC